MLKMLSSTANTEHLYLQGHLVDMANAWLIMLLILQRVSVLMASEGGLLVAKFFTIEGTVAYDRARS